MLEAEAHQTFEAVDGVEALGILEREPIDAVISDVLMPRMDGYRLCKEVRKSERLRGIALIVYTASYTSPADEKLCLELGADQYLRKPAPLQDLLAAINTAVSSPRRPIAPGFEETDVLREYSERL